MSPAATVVVWLPATAKQHMRCLDIRVREKQLLLDRRPMQRANGVRARREVQTLAEIVRAELLMAS